jgi:hypothetical protein
MLMLAYFPEKNPARSRLMAFDMRWAKRDLLEAFEGWVDRAIAERTEEGLKQERPQRRFRLREYKDYLKVYDLRCDGKKFKEVAKALRWSGDVDDLEKRARDYYRKARALVEDPPLTPKGHRVQKPGA